MTSSGVSVFADTMSDIITAAYRTTCIIPLAAVADAAQLKAGREKLNRLAGEWMATGLHVWTTEEAILFLAQDQTRYQLGLTGSANCTDAFDYAQTTLTAAAVAGAASLTVDSITDIASADYLGIELDDGSMQWTTVNGAPAGSTVVPTAVLTGAASIGNNVFAYTTKILRPLKVVNARYRNHTSEQEVEAKDLSHLDYQRLPNKTNASVPFTQWWYQPKIPFGFMTVWPQPSDVSYGMRLTYHRPIFDWTSNADTADFPREWGNCLIYQLAVELIPDGSVPTELADKIMMMAGNKMKLVMGYDREESSILYQPDFEG